MRTTMVLATALLIQACGGSSSTTETSAPGDPPSGTQSCSGNNPQGANLVANGGFESSPDQVIEPGADINGWTSGYRYKGLHPATVLAGNEIAAFTGFLDFELVKQKQFEGDAAYGVSGSTHFLFSDGDSEILTVWRQTVSGLVSGNTYAFTAYVSNALIKDWKQEPIVSLRADGVELLSQLVDYDGLGGEYSASQDRWTRVSVSFEATSSDVVLEIVDTQDGGTVNDLALTAISLQGCN